MTTSPSVLNLRGGPRMLDAVREGLSRASDVRIAVSFTRCAGLDLLVDPLREMVGRGGKARVLTSTYQAVTQPDALVSLSGLSGVETRVQDGPIGFHAKFWWFGSEGAGVCWAGSSNLTRGGLVSNLEWNLCRTEQEVLEQTGTEFEQLWARPDVLPCDDTLIGRYRDHYQALHLPKASVLVPGLTGEGPLPSPWGPPPSPNEAQAEALERLLGLRALGVRAAAVIAATGVGKTYLAAFDVRASEAKTVLYVSHRLEHLTQAFRSFDSVFRGRRTLGLVGGSRDEPDADIVFATVASLGRRPELAGRKVDYLIIDEFHHVEARSYQVLRPLCGRAFLLGITATPERQDGRNILEWCDRNIAYEVRLPEAIDRGWLLPFHYFGVADETLDFRGFHNWSVEQQEEQLLVEARVDLVLKNALEYGFDGPKRATVGFCVGVRHARYMAKELRRRGYEALAVDGEQTIEERERIYKRFGDPHDRLQWLFVADVLNEGVDIPAINSILFLRPTESATLFLQQLGRGIRKTPGTEVLTVLDFVGHHERAWLALNALHDPQGGGPRIEVAPGQRVTPPTGCEIVLQEQTKKILQKIARFPKRRERCEEAWKRLRQELGRTPRPVDLWGRDDVPTLRVFLDTYGSWLAAQRAHGDEPAWAKRMADDHVAARFLRALERDWQQQRVWAYALTWALCASPEHPEAGFIKFFELFPAWKVEFLDTPKPTTWKSLEEKLGGALNDRRLAGEVLRSLDLALLQEVEGRLFYTMAKDHRDRHEGALRTPDRSQRCERSSGTSSAETEGRWSFQAAADV